MVFQALPRVDTYSTPYLKIILFIVIKKIAYLIMLGRSCCGGKIKVNLINYLSVTPLVNIYLCIGHHFEIELKNI